MVGFFLGFGGHVLLDHAFAKSKAQQLADLFEQICIKGEPARDFQSRIPPRMVKSDSFGPDARIWIDPVTQVFVDLNGTKCSMKLYGDDSFLTDDMGHALLLRVTELVETHFPQIKIDPKALMGSNDIFVAWTNWRETKTGSPQRRGVILWIHDHGEKSTLLSLTPPSDGTRLDP